METASFAHPRRNVEALGIEPGMKVADFGAGSGAYVLLMAEMLHGTGVVYAIDIQKDLLRRIKNEATKRSLTMEIIWGDLEEEGGSKLADTVLDLVLISNLLFQVKNKASVVREAVRIVRPGGRVVVIDWSESYGGMGPHPDHVCTKEATLRLASEQGLVLVKDFEAGAHHYGLIFRKTSPATARA